MNLVPEPGLEFGTLASAFGMLTTRLRLTVMCYVFNQVIVKCILINLVGQSSYAETSQGYHLTFSFLFSLICLLDHLTFYFALKLISKFSNTLQCLKHFILGCWVPQLYCHLQENLSPNALARQELLKSLFIVITGYLHFLLCQTLFSKLDSISLNPTRYCNIKWNTMVQVFLVGLMPKHVAELVGPLASE